MMCTQGVRLVESNTLRAHLIDKGSEQVLKIPAALVNISKGPAHSYIYRSKARRTVPSVAPAGPRLPPLVRQATQVRIGVRRAAGAEAPVFAILTLAGMLTLFALAE